MLSYLLLLELGNKGWEFSWHAWFMRFLLLWPTGEEQSIQAFATISLKLNNDMPLPRFV